jgi:CheY-like chemotaxis protein
MPKRILLVEDQDDNLQILRDLLTSAGFEIIEAKDGEAGVKTAVAERPDLILMDIQLPRLDGYEATRRIKADPTLTATPSNFVCPEWGRHQGARCGLRCLRTETLESTLSFYREL